MEFYEKTLGLELGMKEQERRVAFYWIGGQGKTALGLWENPPWALERDAGNRIIKQHFAFEVDPSNLGSVVAGLKQRGIQPRNFFGEATDTPSVFGWVPAASISLLAKPSASSLAKNFRVWKTPPKPRNNLLFSGIFTLSNCNIRRQSLPSGTARQDCQEYVPEGLKRNFGICNCHHQWTGVPGKRWHATTSTLLGEPAIIFKCNRISKFCSGPEGVTPHFCNTPERRDKSVASLPAASVPSRFSPANKRTCPF